MNRLTVLEHESISDTCNRNYLLITRKVHRYKSFPIFFALSPCRRRLNRSSPLFLCLYLSISLFVCLCLPLSVSASLLLSVCLYVCLCLCLSLSQSLSASLSISLSLSLYVGLSLWPCAYLVGGDQKIHDTSTLLETLLWSCLKRQTHINWFFCYLSIE